LLAHIAAAELELGLPEWSCGTSGGGDFLVAGVLGDAAVAKLADDLAEAGVGQGVAEEDQRTEEPEGGWTEADQPRMVSRAVSVCSGSFESKPPRASA
jgi:hypothetical protein